MACDVRIARAGDYQIGLPEVGLGILPGMGGTQRLVRLMGKGRALEMLIEGQNLPAETAQAVGLVHKVWAAETHDEFMRQVIDYAREFCPPGRSPLAVGQIKRAVHTASETPLEQGLALERELQQRLFASQDAREGLAAFTQKREAAFRAR
jgi:enoyl-CoA hydratase/carnithine racemase